MKSTFVIAKKDFYGFIFNPTYYVVGFLVSIIFSWIYPITLNRFAASLQNSMYTGVASDRMNNIHYGVFIGQLSYMNLILLFIVPALTMKLIAEEKKVRTFDLLLTSPISSASIVVGKYLASLGAVFGLMLIAFLYPVATLAFAKIDWVPLLSLYFAVFMCGAVYSAIGLFCSSLTESVIAAYVMAVVMNFFTWFVGMGADTVDSSMWRQIFEHLSMSSHVSGMVEGTFRTSAIVFLFSVIGLFCFMAERVVEANRWR